MWLIDICAARILFTNETAQWYFLHSIANAFVVILAIQDFYFGALQIVPCYEMVKLVQACLT